MANNGNPEKSTLTPTQRRAIVCLLTERDVKAAAQAAGVGYRTLMRWLELPAFRAALLAAEGEAIDQVTRRLVQLAEPAVSVLTWAMADKGNSPAVRLRAAQAVLDGLLKLRELRNTEERLAALEDKVFGGEQ